MEDFERNQIICFKRLDGYRILHCAPAYQPYGCAWKNHDEIPIKVVEDRIMHHYWDPARVRNDRGQWCDSARSAFFTEKQVTLVESDILAVFLDNEQCNH